MKTQRDEQHSIDLALLRTVRLLSRNQGRKMTFGQIYMQMVRSQQSIPPIAQCVVAVDVLVKEGLLVSERILEKDPAFPYIQHIISGLTDIGAACLT